MAEQKTTSQPLRDESEEEKRRRKAAQNYLAGRSAYDKARSQGVDMTDVDYGKMSEADFKAEGLRRLDNIKSNFETAALAANKEGINSSKAAQDYLNRGQARIVGDTLVGSAAGISASEWEKRDKSAVSGNYALMPTNKETSAVAAGVRMDSDSAGRYLTVNNQKSMDAIAQGNERQKALDTFATAQANNRLMQEQKAKESLDRYNNFRRGIDNAGDTMTAFRQERGDRSILQQQAAAEQKAASREYRSARAGLRNLERSGKPVGAAELQAATDRLTAAEDGLSPSRDANDRQSFFTEMARRRLNPFGDSVAPTPASTSMTLGGTPNMSLIADEDPDEKRRKTGRGLDLTNYS